MWFNNQNLSHTLFWKPQLNRVAWSKLINLQLGSSGLWEWGLSGDYRQLSRCCLWVALSAAHVQSFQVVTGFRSLSNRRHAMKWDPALSGTASTFQDLTFLVKGQKQAAWGATMSWKQGLQTDFSFWPFCLGGFECKSLTNQFLHFWSEREGLHNPWDSEALACYNSKPQSHRVATVVLAPC